MITSNTAAIRLVPPLAAPPNRMGNCSKICLMLGCVSEPVVLADNANELF